MGAGSCASRMRPWAEALGEIMAGEFDLLLGRRTYEIFAAYWPYAGDNPIANAFNKATKYVVMNSLGQIRLGEHAWHERRRR